MARALKVYRTPIGFHDAYVATPSQKAALEAWGADANLFARGSAEQVTEAELMREPLANPGKVIKRPRGSEAEHLASLAKSPQQPGGAKSRPGKATPPNSPPKRASPATPRPSREPLDRAEEALALQEEEDRAALKKLKEKQAQLRAQIEQLRKQQQAAYRQLADRVDNERRKYDTALERWRAS
ncbi:hypothetical protein [Sphingobium chungangianum]